MVSRLEVRDNPVGTGVADGIEGKRTESIRYRRTAERLESFEQLARAVIMVRAKLGLSQRDLARRMGTTPSVIARLESGHQ